MEQCNTCKYFKLYNIPKFEKEAIDRSWESIMKNNWNRESTKEKEESLAKSWYNSIRTIVDYYEDNKDKIDCGICRWDRDKQPEVLRTHLCHHYTETK